MVRKSLFRQAGLTLIEIMVALVIGMIVVFAGLTLYLASAHNARLHRAQARLASDLSNVMTLLSSQVRMAGYSTVHAHAQGTSIQTRSYEGPAIWGCDGGYADASAMPTASCVGTGAPDALTLYFEVDRYSAASTGGVPLDCRGQSVPAATLPPHLMIEGTSNVYYLAEQRVQVIGAAGAGRLVCLGNGGPSPFIGQAATLAEGVVDFQVTYTVVDPSGTDVAQGGAQEVVALYGGAAQAWKNVLSLNLCMVLSSEEQVLDAPGPYPGCTGGLITPADRRLYRTARVSLALRNQIPSGL